MASSASAICDALVTMLSATSVLGASGVWVNDYGVLETASGSCAVVGFTGLEGLPYAQGGGAFDSVETYFINSFVKDTGNPSADVNRIHTLATAIYNCIKADNGLQGTVDIVTRFSANRRPTEAVETGGFIWLPVDCMVEVKQL